MSASMAEAFSEMAQSDVLKENYGSMLLGMMEQAVGGIEFDDGMSLAVSQLLDNMSPSMEQLNSLADSYREAGKKIPEAMAETLQKADSLELLSGSADALWQYVGEQAAASPEYAAAVDKITECGGTLPAAMAKGFENNRPEVEEAISYTAVLARQWVARDFNRVFEANPTLKLNWSVSGSGMLPEANYGGAVRHADGGIFDTPHFGVFGEAGPEAFIPLDRSPRSVAVWEEAGRLLGAESQVTNQTDSSRMEIHYSPVYQMADPSRAGEIKQAVSEDYERFVSFMDRYEKDRRRLAF